MVKSAKRVLQILDFVGESKEGLTQKDFITGLGVPKSSMSALLSTLTTNEYLSFNAISRHYRLGPRILTLAGNYLASLDIVRIAEPIIREVAAQVDESTELTIRSGQDIQTIFYVDCTKPVQRVIDLGARSPLHVTAAGKAILANQSNEIINEYLETADMTPTTENSKTDPELIKQELDIVRKSGIAYCREERFIGIMAIAAPIFDRKGDVAGSIVIPVPTIRFDQKKEQELEQALRSASAKLSYQFGYIEK